MRRMSMTTGTRRLGRIKVTAKLLIKLLLLPEGTIIHRVWQDPRLNSDDYEMVIEHPDLPAVEEASVIPVIGIRYRTKDVFDGWIGFTEKEDMLWD
jgi:hypothetical protein